MKRKTAFEQREVVVKIEHIAPENKEACARVIARIAVERALVKLGLDSGPTNDESLGQPQT
jgi:hypothetical protein